MYEHLFNLPITNRAVNIPAAVAQAAAIQLLLAVITAEAAPVPDQAPAPNLLREEDVVAASCTSAWHHLHF